MHTVKETDMLATKMDLLLKKLDEGNRQQMFVPIHAMSSHSICEVCGEGGTRGMTAPRPEKTQPTSTTTTPGSVHKEARGGVKHAHHPKEDVTILTQISI